MQAGIVPELSALISYAFRAHAEKPTKPSKAFRKWDGRTPYGIHPTWAALTLLTETRLPEGLRERGAKVLILHDILENTTSSLPSYLSFTDEGRAVVQLVKEMTFESSAKEMEEIWSRSPEIKLFKLYDKVSNLLDGTWMDAEKRSTYSNYTARLIAEVEQVHGTLNIVLVANAIVDEARA